MLSILLNKHSLSDAEASQQQQESQKLKNALSTRQKDFFELQKRNQILKRQLASLEAKPLAPTLEELGLGARISVYWKDQDRYFNATVNRVRPDSPESIRLLYDNGDIEWINPNRHSIILLQPCPPRENRKINPAAARKAIKKTKKTVGKVMKKMKKTEARSTSPVLGDQVVVTTKKETEPKKTDIGLGDQVAVFWVDHNRYFNGTVSEERFSGAELSRSIRILYDDGDEEWIDLKLDHKDIVLIQRCSKESDSSLKPPKRRMKGTLIDDGLAMTDASKLTVGDRIAVLWTTDNRYYNATVVDKRRKSSKCYRIVYDDHRWEWINPKEHRIVYLS